MNLHLSLGNDKLQEKILKLKFLLNFYLHKIYLCYAVTFY